MIRHAAPVLIAGQWRASSGLDHFHAINPATGQELGEYPVSPWDELDEALNAAEVAFAELSALDPSRHAAFLDGLANAIAAATDDLCHIAHMETALSVRPRLVDVELPRTIDQLRQAAGAARDRTWKLPTVDPTKGIASLLAPMPGAVAVFGPNNFPFAFNGVGGGDFAAAIATGHPVIAKANPGHPGTTRRLAEIAWEAASAADMPPATVQLVYRTSHEDGLRLVADRRLAATAYTGSRAAGLALKSSADAAGIPIYLEMSSVNPVVVMPGAAKERGSEIAEELVASMLTGMGQFCTSPGLIFVQNDDPGKDFMSAFARTLQVSRPGTLLGEAVAAGLDAVDATWTEAGASVLARSPETGPGCSRPHAVFLVDAGAFLRASAALQTEAFGNMALIVQVADLVDLEQCIDALDGNLTGSIFVANDGSDDSHLSPISAALAARVGRLLENKVPTGVALSPAMQHGGPYPSTAHPGFTAVGVPASLRRFGQLTCFDNVKDDRLPIEVQASNPLRIQRFVQGTWTDEVLDPSTT